MQQPGSSSSSHSRADRTTTSCTECRRRKQKCNQGQPCNNCSRRFPQPKCEYIHKNPNGRQQTRGLPNMSVFSAEIAQPLHPPRDVPGHGVAPALASSKTDTPDSGQRASDHHEPRGANKALSTPKLRFQARGTSGGPHAGQRRGDSEGESGVASNTSDDTNEPVLEQVPAAGESWRGTNLWLLADSLASISDLPIKPTKLNAMLVKTFVQHLYRFKGPLDGNPEPDNPFIDHYAPWCFQSRLLAPVALSVAATSLVQLRLMPSQAAMALKGQAIHTLNAYLRSPASATDEAISAVSQLILNDWYFGETRDTQAHLRGLRELVRLRGGFEDQDVNRLVSKTALLTDCFIAISLENSPLNVPEFIFHEPLAGQLNPSYNTPFVFKAHYPSFGKSASLDLAPATARILDDIRYLFSLILQLPPDPSPDELDKVKDTAKLARDSFEKMPDICPDAPTSSIPSSVIGSHSGASSLRQSTSLSPPPVLSSATASPTSSSDASNITMSSASSVPPVAQSHDPSHFILRNQAQSQRQYPPDFLYATVRQTALLYARAAATRTPLSTICPVPQFFVIWSTAFRVSLKEWHQRLGLFLWVIIAVLPTAGHTPFASLAKSLLHIGAVQVGLDHWEVAIEMLRNAVGVVGWLAGSEEDPNRGCDVTVEEQVQSDR